LNNGRKIGKVKAGKYSVLTVFIEVNQPGRFTFTSMEASKSLLHIFPFLRIPELEEEIVKHSSILTVETGEVLIREGQYLKVLPLVISGSLRVVQRSEDREVLLYYVMPGETCIMSLSSCFFNIQSPSTAIADSRAEILNIPARFIKEWQRKYDPWNEFVIGTFQSRYMELLTSFNSVVFNNIDSRITDFLDQYVAKHQTNMIPVTHQALANALGTTRVVVSRILKKMEQEGSIELLRSSIRVIRS